MSSTFAESKFAPHAVLLQCSHNVSQPGIVSKVQRDNNPKVRDLGYMADAAETVLPSVLIYCLLSAQSRVRSGVVLLDNDLIIAQLWTLSAYGMVQFFQGCTIPKCINSLPLRQKVHE